MKKSKKGFRAGLGSFLNKLGLGMRAKLIIIFLIVKIIPLLLVVLISVSQLTALGVRLRDIAVEDSQVALNSSAVQTIERMSTDTAQRVADFLYQRDDDIRYLASLAETYDGNIYQIEKAYEAFVRAQYGRVVEHSEWVLDEETGLWVDTNVNDMSDTLGVSSNTQNEQELYGSTFNTREADDLTYYNAPLYDEVTFIGLDGKELIRISTTDMENSLKNSYADSFVTGELRDVSIKANTFIKAEDYWSALPYLTNEEGNDIYVSDVIGAYVGTNYVGTYTPENLAAASEARGYDIEYAPEEQAYAGQENPNGERFEAIVRWASPVYVNGEKIGYVTLALDHDHIMEFVDHQTPMNERYVEINSAAQGNYAFIWDYQCRSICHPRHSSIVGYDPETGDQQVSWLSQATYERLLAKCGVDETLYNQLTAEERVAILLDNWANIISHSENGQPVYELIIDEPTFNDQSRPAAEGNDPEHTPAADLTKLGFVGLDGRYLNNAPQCTGWLDLSNNGGSGSLYILWSGLWKLNTAAAIPYYTGHYAPSEANGYSKIGFGFVAIGSSLEDFTEPAQATSEQLDKTTAENMNRTSMQLFLTTASLIVLVVIVAIVLASYITNNIQHVINGISRFRRGERQFRFNSKATDEFGQLAQSFDEMADSVVGSVNSPLAITDMDMKLIYMNEYALELNNKVLEDIVGEEYSKDSIYPVGTEYCPITALHEGREAEILYSEAHNRYFRGTANYLLDNSRNRIGYVIVTTDLTEISLKQIELEHAVEAANLANEHKGDFLARMSHEIRTPMNAVIGITSIVKRKLSEIKMESATLEDICEKVAQIETSSQHLLSLLNDILDLSKIEAGKIEIVEEVTDLSKLISTVSGLIEPRCSEKQIKFDVDCDDFSSTAFMTDPLRLRQVLINLLGNAVKFTADSGTIYFGVKTKEQSDGRTLVRFIVRDTGIGIAPEHVETIFSAFEQGDNTVTKRYGGTGLGLSISRSIVQMLGGDIVVTSELGKGSEFAFELWIDETGQEESAEKDVSEVKGRFTKSRILLVDDVDINRMVVATMLEETGAEIVEADDGTTALKLFEQSPVGGFDLILMDVKMPQMDGYEATRRIRELDREDAKSVPIVALTANAYDDDIALALRSGMNSHLAKPVEYETLMKMIIEYL